MPGNTFGHMFRVTTWGESHGPAVGVAVDGWMDEAWDSYSVDASPPLYAEPLDPEAPPVQLCSDSPFTRTTPIESYSDGADVFGHLAYLMGSEVLLEAMNTFYSERALELFSTDELEAYLYCLSGDPEVLYTFHRFVYGLEGAPDEDDVPECPLL